MLSLPASTRPTPRYLQMRRDETSAPVAQRDGTLAPSPTQTSCLPPRRCLPCVFAVSSAVTCCRPASCLPCVFAVSSATPESPNSTAELMYAKHSSSDLPAKLMGCFGSRTTRRRNCSSPSETRRWMSARASLRFRSSEARRGAEITTFSGLGVSAASAQPPAAYTRTRQVGWLEVACRGIILRRQGATERARRGEAAVRCFALGWYAAGGEYRV
jgi:hypothetical protein